MKRKIWLRDGQRAAKAVWVTETDQGLYIGPSAELKSVHYSYHQDGQRHLTYSRSQHFSRRSAKDSALSAVTEHRNVGGFSVDPAKLQWDVRSSFRDADILIDYEKAARSDLPFLVSLHVSTDANLPAFIASIRSLGPGCKDICISFDLPLFPHLKGLVQIQYHTR